MEALPRSIRWQIQLGIFQAVEPSLSPVSSTIDLLDAILETNRSALTQYTERFQKQMEEHVEEEIGEEEERPPEHDSPSVPEIDPLTAMVMEQQAVETRNAELLLKYKKERARRKRGLTSEGRTIGDENDGIDRASLVIIEKDLKRLPHPTSNGGAASGNLTSAEEARIANLKEILYIYAQEHPGMGYRQGMHEIASYLLFVLELEKPQYPNHKLFESELATCFIMLENTLDQLHLAYDALGEQSLQRMSHSILSKIHQNDSVLYNFLTTSPNIPPPPIYCTRWVRLLFSREVVGYENVFLLWDAFFEYHNDIMRTLEVTSAARILLLRDALMSPENNPLDLLMNVPQLTDTTPLLSLLRKLMEQSDTDDPIPLPNTQTWAQPWSPPRQQQPTTIPPVPTPQSHHLLAAQPSSMESPPNSTNQANQNFSFSKMRQTLGQKSESLRKKIVTATNDWKKETSAGSSSQYSGSADFFASSMGDSDRSHSNVYNPSAQAAAFHDPLMNPSSGPMAAPPSPRKHQHSRWSQLLKGRILVVQQFMMSIESTEEPRAKIPPEVWEAMADMQRMQQELHNYSVNMS